MLLLIQNFIHNRASERRLTSELALRVSQLATGRNLADAAAAAGSRPLSASGAIYCYRVSFVRLCICVCVRYSANEPQESACKRRRLREEGEEEEADEENGLERGEELLLLLQPLM